MTEHTLNYSLDSGDKKLSYKKRDFCTQLVLESGGVFSTSFNSRDIARCRSEARKQRVVVRFGYLERLVLEYSKHHTSVQAAAVRSWAGSELGLDLNLKRIHDAVKRLVRKGVLLKKSHGVYTLTDFGVSLIPTLKPITLKPFNSNANQIRKETDSLRCSSCRDSSGGGRVVRVHVNTSSFEDYVRIVYLAEGVLRCALRYVRSLVGDSRFREIVRGVGFDCLGFFFGVHGVRGYRFRELKDIRFVEALGLVPNEMGFDVYGVVEGVDRFFLKVYTR